MKETKIAIITGASKGIGRAISLGFAQNNYKTILIARSENALISLKKEITEKFPNCPEAEIHVCDLSKIEIVNTVLEEITLKHKVINVLVNNAGVYRSGSIENTLEDFKDLLDVNLSAPFLFLKAVVPVMKNQGFGYIFNIASRAAKIGFAGNGFYASSKFALLGLSESLYRELSKLNIKVTALCPSFVNTPMAVEAGATIKGDEMIQPEDLALTINYLLNLSKDAYVRELMIDCRKTIV